MSKPIQTGMPAAYPGTGFRSTKMLNCGGITAHGEPIVVPSLQTSACPDIGIPPMSCVDVAAVGLHLFSWHSSGDFNNATLGAYARLDCSIQAGIFYNSERRATVYGGYAFEDETGEFPFFALLGVGTGYEVAPIIPIAAVGVKLGDHLRVSYAPQVEVTGAHVLHLTVEFPL